tara:strand:- start:3775 stop:4455 length:681 start_codon:yes stop_codon:yes gene_type:complete
MLIKFNDSLNLKTIKNICKINGIKKVYNYNKMDMLNHLNKYKSVVKIQREFRKKTMRSETCPISLEVLKYPFVSFKINNVFVYYDFNTLIKYFNRIEDIIDPLTRQKLNYKSINYLNDMIRYYYKYNSNKILISKEMIKNSELNIIIYCLYDLINETKKTNDITIDYIYKNIMPRLIYYVHFLIKSHSVEDILLILNACKMSFNSNLNKHIEIIINYLELIIELYV